MESLPLTAANIDIEAMQAVELGTVDRDTLKDIREVKVDTTLPKKERLLDYIHQIGNPYCYRYDKYTVKVSFSDTEATLEDRMRSYIRSKGWHYESN